MALKDVLYRCPLCGADAMEGRKDHAHCSSCGRHYLRGPAPARIRVEEPGGERAVLAAELVERVGSFAGPVTGDGGEGSGEEVQETPVRVRWAVGEETVRYGGELLGFTERLGPRTEMRLRLTPTALELLGDEDRRRRWNLMDLRAVQVSSSSLQVYTLARELVHFRFLDDSAFRWETLLQETLRAAYREAGKGEIIEFQPRITVR